MHDQTSMSFTVRGIPMPKGSVTRMPGGAMIPAGTRESRGRMDAWRNAIQTEAAKAMGECPPFEGGIRLWVEFALPVPKTLPKKHIGWLPHTKKPDVDKLLRAMCDALTGVAWRDDSQCCIVAINKVYAWDGITGAIVTVETITEHNARRNAELTQHIRERVRQ